MILSGRDMEHDEGLEPIVADSSIDDGDDGGDDLSPAELRALLKKANREAAKRRVEGNQTKAENEEYRKWKESQKSELERLTEGKLKAEADLAELRHESLQIKAAKAAGLDEDLADRLRGKSYEELLADAEEFAERAVAKKRGDIDPFAGRTGPAPKNEASVEDAFGAWIRHNTR